VHRAPIIPRTVSPQIQAAAVGVQELRWDEHHILAPELSQQGGVLGVWSANIQSSDRTA